MSYKENTGPTDYRGTVIKDGDYVVVGTNARVRAGKVIAVKDRTVQDYRGVVSGYVYAITIDKGDVPEGERRIQSFDHELLGADKFWVITHIED